ncbi:MAG: aldehyde dehydrogenase family protein, partial [Alistipes sp.]|nr:aldehyde dehydrogenase family protein [Alistipes sp.]
MDRLYSEKIQNIAKAQKKFFSSGATLDLDFRKRMLKQFLAVFERWEQRLCDALWTDLHKSYEEAYLTEISIVKAEIKMHLRHLSSWAKRRKAASPLKMFPSKSYVVKEPLGNALIVSPWNYPVQLLLNPLVGAISSGCTAMLKPSPYVPHVSQVIADMVEQNFDSEYIAVVQGNREV